MKIKTITGRSLADVARQLSTWLDSAQVTVITATYGVTEKGREVLVVYRDGAAPELPTAVRDWITEQLSDRKIS